MTCQLCEEDSGRFNANNECCQMRLVANLPKSHRQQYYQKVLSEKGNAAANEVIAKVNAILEQKRNLRQSTNQGEKEC